MRTFTNLAAIWHLWLKECKIILAWWSQIAMFMVPTWGPPGSCRPQMGPILAQWTLLSGIKQSFRITTSTHMLLYTQPAIGYLQNSCHQPNWEDHIIGHSRACTGYGAVYPCVHIHQHWLSPLKAWNNVLHSKDYGTCFSLITRLMGPTWGPSGANRTQVGPMLAPWTLLSGLEINNSMEFGAYWVTKYAAKPAYLFCDTHFIL